jgi:hypothetical protein
MTRSLHASRRFQGVLWHLAALLAPLPLAVAFMHPLIGHFGDGVIGGAGDNLAYVWVVHWLREVVAGRADLFFDPGMYYPVGYNAVAIESTIANSALALPVTVIFGPVAGYNAALLASFSLTSYGTFLLIRSLTGNPWLALMAGVVSAFFPYRLVHLRGQLPQMSTQWIPLLFYAIERYLSARRLRWGVAIGLFFALNALSSWYTMVFVAPAVALYLLLRARSVKALAGQPRFWRDMAVGAAVAALLITPIAVPYLLAQSQLPRAYSRPYIAMRVFSINPAQIFLAPNVHHPLWGDWAAEQPISRNMRIAHLRTAFSGYLLLAAALVGVVITPFHRRRRALLALAALGVIGAMGPVLVDYNAKPVMVSLPAPIFQMLDQAGVVQRIGDWFDPALVEEMRASQSVIVPLPYALVYRLPFISSMRIVSRYGILLNFAVCGLAFLGIAQLIRRLRRRLRHSDRARAMTPAIITVSVALFAALCVFEYWQKPYKLVTLEARPVDHWLAEQPFGAVLELPVETRTVAVQRLAIVYSFSYHHKPLVLGMRGSFPPPIDAERKAVIARLPEAEAARALCEWGTRYVLLNLSLLNDEERSLWLDALSEMPVRTDQAQFENIVVYTLTGCP